MEDNRNSEADGGGGFGDKRRDDDDAPRPPSAGSPSPADMMATETKVFVGGLPAEARETDLRDHFAQFGHVKWAQVKMDPLTNRSRGFGFVEFVDAKCCAQALSAREQYIQGKRCEVKRAKYRENKKVFVGGIASDFPEAQLRRHFEAFGPVEEIEWPQDVSRGVRRNFAFVIFETERAADLSVAEPRQVFAGRECDVKKAFMTIRRPAYVQQMCEELQNTLALAASPHRHGTPPPMSLVAGGGDALHQQHGCDYFNHPFVLPKAHGDRLFGPTPSSVQMMDVSSVFTTFRDLLEKRLEEERQSAMQAQQNRASRYRRRPASYSASAAGNQQQREPKDTVGKQQQEEAGHGRAAAQQRALRSADPAVVTCALRDDATVHKVSEEQSAADRIMELVSGGGGGRPQHRQQQPRDYADKENAGEPQARRTKQRPGYHEELAAAGGPWEQHEMQYGLNRPNPSYNSRYRTNDYYNWRHYWY